MTNFPEKYAVTALPRYQSADGSIHETAADAITANRRIALGDIYEGLTQTRAVFATMPRELFIDACMERGREIGEAAVRPVNLKGQADETASVMPRVPAEAANRTPVQTNTDPSARDMAARLLRPATAAEPRPIRPVDPRAKPSLQNAADAHETELVSAIEEELTRRPVSSKPAGFA